MKRLSQAGDTIVEVLICMAVISLVLGGAFVTTRKSQLGVRNSQEHAEALKLAESQIEQLRPDANEAEQLSTPNPFCMYQGTPHVASNAQYCQQDTNGNTGNQDSRYSLSIGRVSSISGSYIFTIKVTWLEVVNNSTAQEVMVYRLYP